MTQQTPFVETEALLAVLEKDEDKLASILRGMLPGELADLKQACRYLGDMCGSAFRLKQREGGAS